jgi:glycosyltransferase involved in cell wall biosynthesis
MHKIKMNAPIPTVSIIVPGYNAAGTLEVSLSSLRNQNWPKERFEIIYVDDASTDESIEIASRWADRVVRLAESPKGAAEARNSGARESKSDILVFIDSDIVAPPNTIKALAEILVADEALAAVFGSYDNKPFDLSFVSQYRNLLHHFVHQTSRHNAATFWAGCGATRRRAFEISGGFDATRYRGAMIEDIELGRRMCALGMKIRLEPSIQVKHLKKWTFREMLRSDIFSRGIPWLRLLFCSNRANGEIGDLNLKLSGMLSVALVWAGLLFLAASLAIPGLCYAALAAFIIVGIINFSTYRFFWRARGLVFVALIIPLHFLFHFCNGLSVLIALIYRSLIDSPLPGLKSIGSKLQTWYWSRIHGDR